MVNDEVRRWKSWLRCVEGFEQMAKQVVWGEVVSIFVVPGGGVGEDR